MAECTVSSPDRLGAKSIYASISPLLADSAYKRKHASFSISVRSSAFAIEIKLKFEINAINTTIRKFIYDFSFLLIIP